jgi:flagellar biosynthetic protein FlhB
LAEQQADAEDKTEDASPERREEFRERGQVVSSREVTSVFILGAIVIFLSFYVPQTFDSLRKLTSFYLEHAAFTDVNLTNIISLGTDAWLQLLMLIAPPFLVTTVTAAGVTLLQTRFNWSWTKIAPDFSRLDPIQGVARMFSMNSLLELVKSILKVFGIGLVAWLILKSEWKIVPGLAGFPVMQAWVHFLEITKSMFWSIAALMVFVGAIDYIFNFVQLERQMRMSKQEVKEEYKRREVDPQVKARMRRIQREQATRKTLEAVKTATAVVTNPTHFAVAIRYELGMSAPIVVAKGIDHLALRMREVAKENKIEIVENKPLARTLYKLVEVGQEIPETLYRAVSEIIRYVFNLRGIKVSKKTKTTRAS